MATTTSTATATSGLDVNTLVSQLMTVERQPLTKLNAKEASYQAKLSAYGSIKSAVSSLQTSLDNLTSSKFQAVTASFSDASAFSATTTSSAVAGSYSLEVSTLAQAQKLATTGQADTATAIGSGTLTFDFGTTSGGVFTSGGAGTHSITIDSSNYTLAGIRDAINAAGIGVTANIVNDGSATPYKLVLSSNSTGLANTMQISVAGDAALYNLLNHEPGVAANLTETVPAQNATMLVDGVSVSKNSNTVSDVITGVTLNLKQATTAPVTMTVAKDTATINASISTFVKSYNTLSSTLKSLSAYNATTQTGAVLQGDGTIRTLQSQLRAILNSSVTSGAYSSLSDIGIGFQTDGTLAINQTKLDSALSSNFSDVAGLFTSTGAPAGYATQLDNFATDILSSTGLITSRTEGLNAVITNIGNRKLDLEARLVVIEKRYRTQFSNLDAMLGGMNVTSNYLTQQLARL